MTRALPSALTLQSPSGSTSLPQPASSLPSASGLGPLFFARLVPIANDPKKRPTSWGSSRLPADAAIKAKIDCPERYWRIRIVAMTPRSGWARIVKSRPGYALEPDLLFRHNLPVEQLGEIIAEGNKLVSLGAFHDGCRKRDILGHIDNRRRVANEIDDLDAAAGTALVLDLVGRRRAGKSTTNFPSLETTVCHGAVSVSGA